MSSRKPFTPDQVRQKFRNKGLTFTQWARDHGYSRESVYRVLCGQDKAHYGQAHEIACALGLKVPNGESSASAPGGNVRSRTAA